MSITILDGSELKETVIPNKEVKAVVEILSDSEIKGVILQKINNKFDVKLSVQDLNALLSSGTNDKFSQSIIDFYNSSFEKLCKQREKNKIKFQQKTTTEINEDYKVYNRKINSCPLCVMNNSFIDTSIFFLNWGIEDLTNYLLSENLAINISNDTFETHKKHIFASNTKDNIQNSITNEINEIDNYALTEIKDLNVITARMQKILLQLKKMENEGYGYTEEYNNLNNTVYKLIETKNKLLNNDNFSSKTTINNTFDIGKLIREYQEKPEKPVE